MNNGRKFPPPAHVPAHRPGQRPTRPHAPNVLQPKAANVLQPKAAAPARPHPPAPPAYRPCPTPKVLQAKSALPARPTAPNQSQPVAPPAYRPQPPPRVLQTKPAVAPPAPRPSAQPPQRPSAVQAHKAAGAAPRPPAPPAAGTRAVIQLACAHCTNVFCTDGSVCGNTGRRRKRKYEIGTHGAKKSEQQRLNKKFKKAKVKVTGRDFESEHTVGYEPIAQTVNVKRGKGVRARTLENFAPAYQEVKEFHRDNIGTGNRKTEDESGFNSRTYRDTQRELIESGNVTGAVQINQLTYSFQDDFKATPKNKRKRKMRKIANDSYNVMVGSMDTFTYGEQDEDKTVEVSRKDKAEMYLARQMAQTGRWPTQEEIREANELFETHKDWEG